MIDHLLNMACTIYSFTKGTNEWGEPTSTLGDGVDTYCYAEQIDATEVVVGQETYTTDVRVFLPAGTDITGASWVAVGEAIYEVVGSPAVRTKPNLDVSHVEALCREVTST